MACYKNIIYGPTADDLTPNTATNVIIPATGKPQLSIVPIYGDDDFQIACYEYSLRIDTVIYSQTAVLPDIEAEVKRIKDILTTPGLRLVIYPVGLGTMVAVNGTVGTPELRGGPFPQKVIVEPVASNNAIAINWEVMFRIKHCTSITPELIQYNTELDFDVDDDGDIVFTFRATYQQRQVISVAALDTLTLQIIQDVGKSFPGMKRRKRTSLSRDQKTAHITIEFRQIKSDSAFFANTRNVEAIDELSSELLGTGMMQGSGFYTWNRKLSVTVNLPPRIHKSYAWTVYKKILAERFRNMKQLLKYETVVDTQHPTSQGASNSADQRKNWYLPLSLRIINPVYSRSLHVEEDYLLCTDLETLLSKTLICARVNTEYIDNPDPTPDTPRTLSDQWVIWDNTSNKSLAGVGTFTASGPIIYLQCSSALDTPTLKMNALLTAEDDPDQTLPPTTGTAADDPVAQKYSWVDYKNEFFLIEDANTFQVSYLQDTPPSYYQASDESAAASRDTIGFQINSRYTDPNALDTKPTTIARTNSRFKVRMVGHAVRVKFKIPVPAIHSVGGLAVTRTGKAIAVHQQISQGTTPVYYAAWDITYNVDSNVHATDIMQTIKTSGDPAHYR